MAEIRLIAMRHDRLGGPAVPSRLGARIREFDGHTGKCNELLLSIGDSTISIWPADPDYIRDLGVTLINIAEDLAERMGMK